MNCVICGKKNEGAEPGHDDSWYQASDAPESKVWACPACAEKRTCALCGTLMEETFTKEDWVEGQLLNVTQVTCWYCGHTETRCEPEEQSHERD